MIYIPSYAWWLVLATTAAAAIALVALLLSSEPGKLISWRRVVMPLSTLFLAVLLFLWEHYNQLQIGRGHPLDLSHLIEELLPLALLSAFFGVILKSWRGWLSLIAAGLFLDGLLLLFQPGPVVNHLFQLLSVLALLVGLWTLVLTRQNWLAASSSLALGGSIGVFCEIGMVYLRL